MGYEFLEHTADIKIRVKAESVKEIFKQSFEALNEVIKGEIKVKGILKKEIIVEGNGLISLLRNFLNEILYLLEAENFLTKRITKIDINEKKFLKAELLGDCADKYKFNNEVKAVTYNDMDIRKKGNKFVAVFVLDV